MDILALGRVHEDKIIRFRKFLHHRKGVPLDERDHPFLPRLPEILPGNGDPLLIVLDGSDVPALRQISTHQKRRKSHRRPDLQDLAGLMHHKERFQEALSLLADDRHPRGQRLRLDPLQKRLFRRLQGSHISRKSLVNDHFGTPLLPFWYTPARILVQGKRQFRT